MENKLKEIAALNLKITHIAPSHGIIWHRYIKELLNAYMEFATYQSKDKAVIVYESVWHHTQAMAEALAAVSYTHLCLSVDRRCKHCLDQFMLLFFWFLYFHRG